MCKVAGVTKITDKNRNDVWVFMELLGQKMTWGNSDGLGYAAVNESGQLFGEKWLINETAFKDLSQVKSITVAKMEKIYSYFGQVNRNDATAIILHTRAATCGRGIENAHPFVDDIKAPNVAIVHNGVIFNEREFIRKYSTCDSEVLAHLYMDYKVGENFKNINNFTKQLEGWFTVLSLSKNMILDMYTDNGRLSSYFIEELDTRVWSSQAYDIKSVADSLGLTASDPQSLRADSAMRIDVLTGEVLEFMDIETAPVESAKILSKNDGWGNIYEMEGSLDDKTFREYFFGLGGNYYGD